MIRLHADPGANAPLELAWRPATKRGLLFALTDLEVAAGAALERTGSNS